MEATALGIARLRSNAGSQRQFDAKAAAAAFGAVDGDLSAMGQADRADDGESQPSSTHLTGACFVGSIEAFKNVWQIVSRNAQTGISHFENRMIVLPSYRDADISSFGRVLNGVIQEVHDYLLQPGRISLHFDGVSSVRCQRNAF